MPASASPPIATEAERLRSLLASGRLLHPYLSADCFARRPPPAPNAGAAAPSDADSAAHAVRDSFVDLAAALAACCGAPPPHDPGSAPSEEEEEELPLGAHWANDERIAREIQRRRRRLVSDIGGNKVDDRHNNDGDNNPTQNSGGDAYERRHIVLILCDGMGNAVLQSARRGRGAGPPSFFARYNQPARLRAVFPSTTPAALTTLATAAWPGRHGMPGWNLRDKKGCDFPGSQDAASQPVQLLVLSDRIRDARSGKPASETGFDSWDDVFVEVPWARQLRGAPERVRPEPERTARRTRAEGRRRMLYVNAYNGDDYQDWSQGGGEGGRRHRNNGTDFSAWFIGDDAARNEANATLFETARIEETAFDTLGRPEGAAAAVAYFRRGIDAALGSIAAAERHGASTFTYLYTAHPDKHMHALGVEHEEVGNVVRGIEEEVERFWNILGRRELLLSGDYEGVDPGGTEPDSGSDGSVDAAVIVTADHGHVTVHGKDMLELPQDILDLLEYACIGVHGKGRHGYLHCRAGLQPRLRRRWRAHAALSAHFLLLTIEEAVEHGLFGPDRVRRRVRPRLGDFVAVAVGAATLVSPSEAAAFKTACRCQGAHGSLLPEEMSIPFILLSPAGR